MKKTITTLIIIVSISGYSAPGARLTWEPVPEARGYYIEIRDSKGRFIVRENISRNHYDLSGLEHGRYTFRIATVNIENERGESTEWLTFTIEKMIVPELNKVSPFEILISETVQELTIEGRNFNSSSRFFLQRGKEEIHLKNVIIKSENQALSSLKTETMKGSYDLVVINKGGGRDVLINSVNIVEPEKEKNRFFAAAGYDINIPLGVWADYFSTSYTAGSVSLQMSAEKYGYNNFLIESGIAAASYSNTASKKKSSIIFLSTGLGLGYYHPALEKLDVFMKFLAGPAYNILTLDESEDGGKITSIDLFAKTAAGVRYYAGGSFFIDTALNWNTFFMADSFFHSYGISIYAGTGF